MVLFENTGINQDVEVRTRHGIFKGVVKYKGSLNGVAGDWIGVHLSQPGKNRLCFAYTLKIARIMQINYKHVC